MITNDKDLFETCEAVLRWGGVWSNNGMYLERRRMVLRDEVSWLSRVLSSDREPTSADIRRDPIDRNTECRMNAGFVKI